MKKDIYSSLCVVQTHVSLDENRNGSVNKYSEKVQFLSHPRKEVLEAVGRKSLSRNKRCSEET